MQKRIKDFLPSPQFTKSLGVLLGIIFLIAGIGFLVSRKSIFSKGGAIATPIVVKEIVENDSDNDGLPDWQETLWGLDPENKDTDNDGISDGDELEIIQKQLQTPTNISSFGTTTQSETKTDQFAEQIVQLVSALQGSGQLTEENKEAIIEQIVAYGENATVQKKFSKDAIATVSDSTLHLENYIQELSNIATSAQITQDDTRLLIYIDPEQFALLQLRYSESEKKYAQLVERLKNMKVPKSIAYEHVEFMNALAAIEITFAHYQQLETDPILMLQSYASLENTFLYFNQSTQNLLQRLQSLYTL